MRSKNRKRKVEPIELMFSEDEEVINSLQLTCNIKNKNNLGPCYDIGVRAARWVWHLILLARREKLINFKVESDPAGVAANRASEKSNTSPLLFLQKKNSLLYQEIRRRVIQDQFYSSRGKMPILSRIKPIPRIDTYFLKIHSNIFLPPTTEPP